MNSYITHTTAAHQLAQQLTSHCKIETASFDEIDEKCDSHA